MDSNDQVLDQSEPIEPDESSQAESLDEVEETSGAVLDTPDANLEEEASEVAEEKPVAKETSTQQMSDQELFMAALDGDFSSTSDQDTFMLPEFQKGSIITGVIASISPNEMLVDVGAKSEGVIGSREIEFLGPEYISGLSVGDEIRVYVANPEDRRGNIVLSVRRALEEQDWKDALDYKEGNRPYESKVTGYNKGGLIVNFGKVRGFVPASQVSAERRRRSVGKSPEQRWGSMVGEEITVKVIEVDRGRNRLILSESAAYEEVRAEQRAELLDNLTIGTVIEGRVISLADFGAFVDIGGIDGLIHLSELAWEPVLHPRDVLRIGQEVKVEIISIDRDRQRIGLSRKSQQDDPWESLIRSYREGQLVQGEVTKLTNFGAFARLVEEPAIEGLVHISELAEHRVKHPAEIVAEGQILTLRIIRIEPDKRRLGLSLKKVTDADYAADDWRDFDLDSDDDADEVTEVKTAAEAEAEAEAEVEAEAEAEVEVEAEAEV
jgi:small subunit ribosomal protein S1